MEFEEMKRLWQEQNILLKRSTAVNEEHMKHIYTQKAHGVIDRLLHWEVFGGIFFMAILVFTAVSTYRLADDVRYLASGSFMILFSAVCIISSVSSVRLLLGITPYAQSLIETKRMLLKYKKRSSQGMKVTWFLIPFILITFIPLEMKTVRNICLYDYPGFFTIFALGIILLSYVVAYISYQLIIKKNIGTIEDNLKALEAFRAE